MAVSKNASKQAIMFGQFPRRRADFIIQFSDEILIGKLSPTSTQRTRPTDLKHFSLLKQEERK